MPRARAQRVTHTIADELGVELARYVVDYDTEQAGVSIVGGLLGIPGGDLSLDGQAPSSLPWDVDAWADVPYGSDVAQVRQAIRALWRRLGGDVGEIEPACSQIR